MLTFSSLNFLYYKLQHIHCITFTCRKRLMNFFKNQVNFGKQKILKYENLNVLKMCLIVPYYYKKFEDDINCIMKTQGPL